MLILFRYCIVNKAKPILDWYVNHDSFVGDDNTQYFWIIPPRICWSKKHFYYRFPECFAVTAFDHFFSLVAQFCMHAYMASSYYNIIFLHQHFWLYRVFYLLSVCCVWSCKRMTWLPHKLNILLAHIWVYIEKRFRWIRSPAGLLHNQDRICSPLSHSHIISI